MDTGDGDDHFEHLLEREVVADLVRALRSGEQWSPSGQDAGTVLVEENGTGLVRVRKQLGGDVVLAVGEREEPLQPGHEQTAGCLRPKGLGGLAHGVDLVGVEGLEELSAAGEVAVEGRHADAGASRDLGHRHLSLSIRERRAGGREDLLAVALSIGSSSPRSGIWRGHLLQNG